MCTSQEILNSDTHNLNAIPIDGCWVRPVFQFLINSSSQTVLDASGRLGSTSSFQCGAWETGSGVSGPLGLTLQPDDAEAHNNLGAAFAQRGELHKALEHFEAALRLRPDFADAKRNLERAQASRASAGR
jgi:tetratricopeptide (TPR) repeat protein